MTTLKINIYITIFAAVTNLKEALSLQNDTRIQKNGKLYDYIEV